MKIASLPALLLFALAGPAAAQLQPEQQGSIRYLHGGIGEDERFELASQRADYNLRLTFAVLRAGNFVADVEVRIVGAVAGVGAEKRELLRAISDGPWFYAQLAPGSYTVSATYAGKAQTRAVQLRERGAAELFFYWDDPAALEGKDMEPERTPSRPKSARPKPRR